MKTWMHASLLSLLLVARAPALPDEPTLIVGSAAPPLTAVSWLQGAPVKAWEHGQIYVLDFWATWCGPCKASIPHVNALAQELADDGVHVIGVAVWPRDGMVPTADFVKSKGSAMGYAIAEDVGGQTARTFMEASGQTGIPTVMIVDGEGKIAWIGHPAGGLDDELAKLVPGFDVPAFERAAADREAARKEVEARRDALMQTMEAAQTSQDWQAFADASNSVFELDTTEYAAFAIYAYQALTKLEDQAAAQAYGRKVLDGVLNNQAVALNLLAWAIVSPDSTTPVAARDLPLAGLAVARADELTAHKDPSVLDTAARVHFLSGDREKAVAIQREALGLATSPDMKSELQTRLDEYLAAG